MARILLVFLLAAQLHLAQETIRIQGHVAVPMRDGARLIADVFRPQGSERVPALINLGPYQKDKLWVTPDTLEEKQNPTMNWETVNPLWWVPRNYACVRVDSRGAGTSPADSTVAGCCATSASPPRSRRW